MFQSISRAVAPVFSAAALGLAVYVHDKTTMTAHASEALPSVVVVGGGAAGLSLAAQLRKKLPANQSITIVEPSDTHYYQPLWTLVGAGIFPKEESARPMASVIPPGCKHIKDSVAKFEPEHNRVVLASGQTLQYDYLAVATGIQVNFDGVKGMKDAVGKNGVCSIYDYNQVEYVNKCIRDVAAAGAKAGKGSAPLEAVFTFPPYPIKCAGAPQKIMWLAEDMIRDAGARANVTVRFVTCGPGMFGVKRYGDALNEMRKEKGVEADFGHTLVEIRGEQKEAVFKLASGELVVKKYDLLHVIPPMKPPAAVMASPLANADGFVDVNKDTLQHTKFKNVFSLGDCSSLPTSRTAAAITAQTPVCSVNMQAVMKGQAPYAKYDGYTSCPIVTGKNTLMLAEFKGPGYGGEPDETFPIAQNVPRYLFFSMKKHFFPYVYWNYMLKGEWFGKNHIRHPVFSA